MTYLDWKKLESSHVEGSIGVWREKLSGDISLLVRPRSWMEAKPRSLMVEITHSWRDWA